MSDPEELYRRHSVAFDKLHASEKEDELVDRMAEAIRHCYSDDALPVDRPSVVAARAALAAARLVIRAEALEEAAKVADEHKHFFGYQVAAAIRALKEKE